MTPRRPERAWLRLTEAERKRWTRLAAATGETLSAWLRRMAYEGERRAEREAGE